MIIKSVFLKSPYFVIHLLNVANGNVMVLHFPPVVYGVLSLVDAFHHGLQLLPSPSFQFGLKLRRPVVIVPGTATSNLIARLALLSLSLISFGKVVQINGFKISLLYMTY